MSSSSKGKEKSEIVKLFTVVVGGRGERCFFLKIEEKDVDF